MAYKSENLNNSVKNARTLLMHALTGACIFYFLIHPISMVVFWLEQNNLEFNFNVIFTSLLKRFGDSFMPEMLGMAFVFILLGITVGLGSGLYYATIKKKDSMLNLQKVQLKRDITLALAQGENDHLEFKSSLRFDYNRKEINLNLEGNILKTIAGFLNTQGGRLIIGVSDNGKVLGLENDFSSLKKRDKDGFELKIYELVYENIGAEFCQYILTSFHHINEYEICVIDIEKSKSPAYLNLKGVVTFYLRIGNSTKPLSVQEAVNYVNMESRFLITS